VLSFIASFILLVISLLTVKNEPVTVDVDDDIDAPGSTRTPTNQRTMLDGGTGTAGSKWSANQYHRQNKSAEQHRSVPAHLINSASDINDDHVLPNTTHSEKKHSLCQKVGRFEV